MKPLILIVNDDGLNVGGINALIDVAKDFGELVVMVPSSNSSGLAHSFTASRPLRVHSITENEWGHVYTCDGTPVDCVKIAVEHFCPRQPQLVISGINHGSNASVNMLYSGTVGAAVEATSFGLCSVAFSLLDQHRNADFKPCLSYVKTVIADLLSNGLPEGVTLNVNFPVTADGVIKGMKVCRQSKARWIDTYEKRIDPNGKPYYWLTGKFECNDLSEDTDIKTLDEGYASVVPLMIDNTGYTFLENIKGRYER